MAVSWTRDKVLKLIEIQGDGAIQAQLYGCKRKQAVYDRIAVELHDAGFEHIGTTGTESQQEDRGKSIELYDIQPGVLESSSTTSHSVTQLPTQ